MKGLLLVVSGPSGAGKSSVLKALFQQVPTCRFSISATTRPPRGDDDKDGHSYQYVTEDHFAAMRDAGMFLEYARVHSHYYGTPREPVEQGLCEGFDVVLDIDVQGAEQVRASGLDAVFVFVAPPSTEELRHRLEKRGTESAASFAERIEAAKKEIEKAREYDYLIINQELDDAVDKLKAILTAEKCRACRVDLPTAPQAVVQ